MTLSIFLNGVVFLLCFRWFRVNFHMIGFLHVFFWFFAAVWMVGSDSMIQTLSRCTVGKWCLDGEMDPGCHGNTFTGIVNIPALQGLHHDLHLGSQRNAGSYQTAGDQSSKTQKQPDIIESIPNILSPKVIFSE